MTPAQCRAARAFLNWSLDQLAGQAGVAVDAVREFEAERRPPPPGAVVALAAAFERGGIEMTGADDGRTGIRLKRAAAGEEGIRPDELNAANDG